MARAAVDAGDGPLTRARYHSLTGRVAYQVRSPDEPRRTDLAHAGLVDPTAQAEATATICRPLSRAFCLSGTRLINLCCSYGREGDARLETHDEDGVVREAWQQGCAGPLVLLAATVGEA
jgi:hypothetical protein